MDIPLEVFTIWFPLLMGFICMVTLVWNFKLIKQKKDRGSTKNGNASIPTAEEEASRPPA